MDANSDLYLVPLNNGAVPTFRDFLLADILFNGKLKARVPALECLLGAHVKVMATSRYMVKKDRVGGR